MPSIRPSRFMTVDHDGQIRMDPSSVPMRWLGSWASRTDSTSPSPTTPDADRHGIVSRSRGLLESESLSLRRDLLSAHEPAAVVAVSRRRQDLRQQQHDRSRGEQAWPAAVSRFRWASSGSWKDSSTARSVLAARKARAQHFCGATARFGRRIRTASIMNLLAAEITARTGKDPGEHYQELTGRVRHAVLHTHRCAGDAGAEGEAGKTIARGGCDCEARRRADHSQTDCGPG